MEDNTFVTNFGLRVSCILHRGATIFCLVCVLYALHVPRATVYAQDTDVTFTLDVGSNTSDLPKIFRPNIDVSGRGFHADKTWPQQLAAQETLNLWEKDIGFSGFFRMQFNLWEISQLEKDKDAQGKLLQNYEAVIQQINAGGGVVILDIFSTPAGLGAVLDRKSSPLDLKAFKALIKKYIRTFSCTKRYNIWYEVWSAPDLDDFFLGRKQEYLNLYRAVAESAAELREETKVHIPVGGPSSSFWFQNFDGNTVVSPETSLIYELIKFCNHRKLPLDFITWHAYSTDPKIERETTRYHRSVPELIRDWLSYFSLDRNTPLIVDEWNYDSGANVLPERRESAQIAASYIFSRLRNMYEAGVNDQLFFSLEDFQNNKEGVVRNIGTFWVGNEASQYAAGAKSIYNAFRMMTLLGQGMFPLSKTEDEFVGLIGTKTNEGYSLLLYNYIDPDVFRNYISRNISTLNPAERKVLLGIIKSGTLDKIRDKEKDISSLRVPARIKALFMKAQKLEDISQKMKTSPRNVKIDFKNFKDSWEYLKYTIDSSCSSNCPFVPVEEKQIQTGESYQESLSLSPYSVTLLVYKKKPQAVQPAASEHPVNSAVPVKQQSETPKPAAEETNPEKK